MNTRCFLPLCLFFPFLVFPLFALDEAGEEEVAEWIYPVSPVLEIIKRQEIAWRPDWPLEAAPDAFTLPEGALSLSLELSGGVIRLEKDAEGRLTAFPLLCEGVLLQAELQSPSGSDMPSFTLGGEGGWTYEYRRAFGGYAVSREESLYYVLLGGAGERFAETWYDRYGNPYGFYAFPKTLTAGELRICGIEGSYGGEASSDPDPEAEVPAEASAEYGRETEVREYYDFDSRANITRVVSAAGEFSALYGRDNRLRYWNMQSGFRNDPFRQDLSLQWDEQGLMVRILGEKTDLRYEYELNEREDWVLRRIFSVNPAYRAFFPSLPLETARRIQYGREE
ncbi:MAG: hypothetical protein LBE10_12440 [Treponema sp.]|jgi:hypothetical protein|nr:hypothetical protein [Treponema sp.]